MRIASHTQTSQSFENEKRMGKKATNRKKMDNEKYNNNKMKKRRSKNRALARVRTITTNGEDDNKTAVVDEEKQILVARVCGTKQQQQADIKLFKLISQCIDFGSFGLVVLGMCF